MSLFDDPDPRIADDVDVDVGDIGDLGDAGDLGEPPVVRLGLTYDPSPREGPKLAMFPPLLVLVGVVSFFLWRWGEQ